MFYNSVAKSAEGGPNLSCQGLNFMYLDGPIRFLETTPDISEAIEMLFPLLAGREPPFEETLGWFQFAYTVGQTGDYVALASTVLVHSAVLE